MALHVYVKRTPTGGCSDLAKPGVLLWPNRVGLAETFPAAQGQNTLEVTLLLLSLMKEMEGRKKEEWKGRKYFQELFKRQKSTLENHMKAEQEAVAAEKAWAARLASPPACVGCAGRGAEGGSTVTSVNVAPTTQKRDLFNTT